MAETPDRLMVARAFMGIGAAGIMPSTLSMLSNVFTEERERARADALHPGRRRAISRIPRVPPPGSPDLMRTLTGRNTAACGDGDLRTTQSTSCAEG